MIMTYNASFDWLRKSGDRANKTSYLPENIYHIPPPESFGIFYSNGMKSRDGHTM